MALTVSEEHLTAAII